MPILSVILNVWENLFLHLNIFTFNFLFPKLCSEMPPSCSFSFFYRQSGLGSMQWKNVGSTILFCCCLILGSIFGAILGSIFGSILGFNIGFDIAFKIGFNNRFNIGFNIGSKLGSILGFNIGFNIGVKYWGSILGSILGFNTGF